MNRFLAASDRTTKAVWPHHMPRDLLQAEVLLQAKVNNFGIISPTENLQNIQSLPGPTDEMNARSTVAKPAIICVSPERWPPPLRPRSHKSIWDRALCNWLDQS